MAYPNRKIRITGGEISPFAVFGESCVELLTSRGYANADDLLRVNAAGDSSWTAQCNGAPVGAVVTYKNLVGNANSIVPVVATQIGKLVLHNTTQGNEAYVSSVNVGALQITVTNAADVAAWANNDVIQVNSPTCVNPAAPPYFFEIDLSGFISVRAKIMSIHFSVFDTGAAGTGGWFHPYQAYNAGAVFGLTTTVVNRWEVFAEPVQVITQRLCHMWDATGAATMTVLSRVMGWEEDAAI